MSNVGPRFKLCRCDAGQISQSFWKLTRGNTHETLEWCGDMEPPLKRGEPIFFDTHKYLASRLEFDLINSKIFDFKFIPQSGDLLTVQFGEDLVENGMPVEFVFSAGQFKRVSNSIYYHSDGLNIAFGEICFIKE